VRDQIVVLAVVLPLLAAPACVLLRHPRVTRLFSLGVVAACFAIAVALLVEVRGGNVISYQLGGWPPPLGIEYRVSVINAYLLVLVTAMALVVLSFHSGGGPSRVPERRRHLYYAVFLLCISGLLGITITGDAFNIFVFLEISSLSSYILVSLANATGLAGGLVHLFNHAVMKGGLFLVVACLLHRVGSVHLDALAGVGRRMPLSCAALVIGGLSLIGVPGTVGFVSKWYLVSGVLERGWTAAAVLILLSSLLALVYVGRVVEALYFRRPAADHVRPDLREAPLGMLAPTWILIAAAVVFGLTTDWTYGVAAEAAELLLQGGI